MDMTGFPDSSARGIDFRIRRYRHDDLGAFERFWNAQGGAAFASRRVNAFRRLVEGNPFSATHNDYLVLEIEGRVAAYEGMMPFRFSVSGEDVDGFIYHDTMVDPGMRGRGLGKRFVKSILEACPEFSVAVWMNAPNMRVFERCGWLPVDGLPTYVRGYTIRNMVNTRLPVFNHAAEASVGALAGLLYRLEKSLSDYSFRGYDVGIVESFDERVDALFHAVRREFPFIAFRTADRMLAGSMRSWTCRLTVSISKLVRSALPVQVPSRCSRRASMSRFISLSSTTRSREGACAIIPPRSVASRARAAGADTVPAPGRPVRLPPAGRARGAAPSVPPGDRTRA